MELTSPVFLRLNPVGVPEYLSEKPTGVHSRIVLRSTAPDDIVVNEIENWQVVLGGKQIAVPL